MKKMKHFWCTSLERVNNIWFECLPFRYAKITIGKLIPNPILQNDEEIAATKVKPADN